MRLVVLGAGLMGRAAAWELARHEGAEVRVADGHTGALSAAQAFLDRAGSEVGRITFERADVERPEEAARVIEGADAVLSAVPYYLNTALAETAIRSGAGFCDLGGNPEVVDSELALDGKAREAGVAIIPDCGLAPGTTNILTAALLERLEGVKKVKIRVGGLPEHPEPPFHYKLVFSPVGLINEYSEPCRVLREGRIQEVPPLTEPEMVEFPEPYGTLEARTTSGGTSTLPRTLEGRLEELDYKTLRYPGHFDVMAALGALGLFSSRPMETGTGTVIPRKLLEEQLGRILQDEDRDVVLLRVTGETGEGLTGRWELIDHEDEETGMSAMQRTTALPAAVVCRMLADGTIQGAGAFPPEKAVPWEPFLEALEPYRMDFSWTEHRSR